MAVAAVVETFGNVALLITNTILECWKTGLIVETLRPGVARAQRTVAPVEVAYPQVALLVALPVFALRLAVSVLALLDVLERLVRGVLAPFAPISGLAQTPIRVHVVLADGSVLARIGGALVDVDLAARPREAGRTDTLEAALLVEAGGLVFARVRLALVDVDLAPGPLEAARTLALEGAGRVDADAVVFAGRPCLTLVYVDLAEATRPTGRTDARGAPIDGRKVTLGIVVTRVVVAAIFELTQQTHSTWRTLAVEVADAVATLARPAGSLGAIVDVLATVVTCPAVDAHTVVVAVSVVAGGAILADVRLDETLVDVLLAVGARETLRTGAGKVGRARRLLSAGSLVLARMAIAALSTGLLLLLD